jgi:hypothetical protein
VSCPFQRSIGPNRKLIDLGSKWGYLSNLTSCCPKYHFQIDHQYSQPRRILISEMLSQRFRLSIKLPKFARTVSTRFQVRSITSTIQARSLTETKTKSQEPLAQRLNIDDPETGDLRAKTQAAQSKSENLNEPPSAETTGSSSQATQEPVAQRNNRDEPPRDSLRGQAHEAVSKSENLKET